MDTAAAILQVLPAVVFLGAGGSKLAGAQMQVANFQRYGHPQSFRVVTGGVEPVGAAGMIAGLFADPITVTAAAWLGVTMVGAAYTDVRRSPPAMVAAPSCCWCSAWPSPPCGWPSSRAREERGAMQIKELGHLVLYVRDLERSRRFYRDVLGFRELGTVGQQAAAPTTSYCRSRSAPTRPRRPADAASGCTTSG